MFTRTGLITLKLSTAFFHFCVLLGSIVLAATELLRRPIKHFVSYCSECYRCGPKNLPTIAIIAFLLGSVIVVLAGSQFRLFGAEIYVANLIGIAVGRELAPFIVAICLLFLATARFTDEIAALDILDKSAYTQCLIRVLAMTSVSPILTLFAFYAALFGGALTGIEQFDLNWYQYWNQVFTVVPISDILLGLFKSIIFGIEIALIGCFYGVVCQKKKKPLGRSIILSISMGILLVVFTDSVIELLLHSLT